MYLGVCTSLFLYLELGTPPPHPSPWANWVNLQSVGYVRTPLASSDGKQVLTNNR